MICEFSGHHVVDGHLNYLLKVWGELGLWFTNHLTWKIKMACIQILIPLWIRLLATSQLPSGTLSSEFTQSEIGLGKTLPWIDQVPVFRNGKSIWRGDVCTSMNPQGCILAVSWCKTTCRIQMADQSNYWLHCLAEAYLLFGVVWHRPLVTPLIFCLMRCCAKGRRRHGVSLVCM